MSTPIQPKKTKIAGLAPRQFILCLLVIIGFVVWKAGLFPKPGPRGPVNINTATMEQLVALPDVDEKIAEDIVKKRPFKTVEELLKVKGIGDKRLAKLRDKITIADAPK